jgi:hypothetical protein
MTRSMLAQAYAWAPTLACNLARNLLPIDATGAQFAARDTLGPRRLPRVPWIATSLAVWRLGGATACKNRLDRGGGLRRS